MPLVHFLLFHPLSRPKDLAASFLTSTSPSLNAAMSWSVACCLTSPPSLYDLAVRASSAPVSSTAAVRTCGSAPFPR